MYNSILRNIIPRDLRRLSEVAQRRVVVNCFCDVCVISDTNKIIEARRYIIFVCDSDHYTEYNLLHEYRQIIASKGINTLFIHVLFSFHYFTQLCLI